MLLCSWARTWNFRMLKWCIEIRWFFCLPVCRRCHRLGRWRHRNKLRRRIDLGISACDFLLWFLSFRNISCRLIFLNFRSGCLRASILICMYSMFAFAGWAWCKRRINRCKVGVRSFELSWQISWYLKHYGLKCSQATKNASGRTKAKSDSRRLEYALSTCEGSWITQRWIKLEYRLDPRFRLLLGSILWVIDRSDNISPASRGRWTVHHWRMKIVWRRLKREINLGWIGVSFICLH